MDKLIGFLYFFSMAILPGYILPILGTYISIRPYTRYWWPTLPELLLILLPLLLYGLLTFISDRQGYSIGLPSLLIAIPVMVTLYFGASEHGFWVPFSQGVAYWVGLLLSLITVVLVYMFYPHKGLGF